MLPHPSLDAEPTSDSPCGLDAGSVNWIKKRCVRVTHVEDDYPHLFAGALVVAGHPNVWRLNDGLPRLSASRLAVLHFKREYALQDVSSDREAVCMERRFVAGLQYGCEDLTSCRSPLGIPVTTSFRTRSGRATP